MGRHLQTGGVSAMSTSGASGIFGVGGVGNCVAGEGVSEKDLLLLAGDGRCYRYLDNNLDASANAGTATFPLTSMAGRGEDYTSNCAPPVIRHSNGNVFAAASTSASVSLSQFSVSGELLASVSIRASLPNVLNVKLIEVSNGNLVVSWSQDGYIHFAIISPQIVDATSMTVIYSTVMYLYYISDGKRQYSLIPLSAGGFLITGPDYNTNKVYFSTFNNSGTAILNKIAWGTTATSDPAGTCAAQLSDGTIALVRSGLTAAVNTKMAIYGLDGNQVLAEAQISTACNPNQIFQFCQGNGCFSLASGADLRVYSNAGTALGTQVANLGSGAGLQPHRTVWDGDKFLVYYVDALTKTLYRRSITSVGVDQGAKWIKCFTSIATAQSNTCWGVDARIAPSGDTAVFVTSDIASPDILHSLTVSPAGDVVFEAQKFYDLTDAQTIRTRVVYIDRFDIAVALMKPGYTGLVAKRMIDASLLGVAAAETAVGDICPFYAGSGAYAINVVAGDSPKAVDHSASHITGNKGLILTNTAVLRGL